ncbi:hypothetical protein OPT61_g1285 [Boeremia exigua]|uniref:Uncharacterized protein n=1 Tax=Boeremia exigua TaxID=749465 RepID=A0ACC2IQP6_9PLEO|nr:hypothetical protein OPT61_g1285 [Boeremia exigua]
MPTYRSINIALHSQFDIETLPEYYPLPHSPLINPSLDQPPESPPLIDDATSTCSVHVPILPGSIFWISYSVSPPVPQGHYFLFKLYIDGEKVTSWCTGKEDDWAGKTMFGLFEGVGGVEGKRKVEKRVLCFRAPDENGRVEGGCVEIRVHRASGRKRVEREVPAFGETGFARSARGICMVDAGRAGAEQPKRFYKFALIDPVDQPFAKFRYYYRTWDQLRDLGLLDVSYAQSEENSMSVIEPCESGAQNDNKGLEGSPNGVCHAELEDVFRADGNGDSPRDWSRARQNMNDIGRHTSETTPSPVNLASPRRDSITSGTYVPRGAPATEVSTGSPQSLRRRGRMAVHRLSVPPSIKFDAPEPASRPLPIPQKNELPSCTATAYRPHPAYPVEEWTMKSPSPVEATQDSSTITPPERKRRLGIMGAGLMDVISSTWKRSLSGTQAPKKSEVVDGPRSVSC